LFFGQGFEARQEGGPKGGRAGVGARGVLWRRGGAGGTTFIFVGAWGFFRGAPEGVGARGTGGDDRFFPNFSGENRGSLVLGHPTTRANGNVWGVVSLPVSQTHQPHTSRWGGSKTGGRKQETESPQRVPESEPRHEHTKKGGREVRGTVRSIGSGPGGGGVDRK